jgi:hypothetical protein
MGLTSELQFTYLCSSRFKPVSFKPTWEAINKKYNMKREYSNLLDLVDLLLTIPVHSAECERGFSRMKNIKTKLRNRLDSGTLTATMRIQLESASIDSFDPMPAVAIWNNSSYRVRRPFQAPYGRKTSGEAVMEVVNVEDSDDEFDNQQSDSDGETAGVPSDDPASPAAIDFMDIFVSDSESGSEFEGFGSQ